MCFISHSKWLWMLILCFNTVARATANEQFYTPSVAENPLLSRHEALSLQPCPQNDPNASVATLADADAERATKAAHKAGDSDAVRTILTQLTDYLEGRLLLSPEQRNQLKTNFIAAWPDTYEAAQSEVHTYIEVYQARNQPLFQASRPIALDALSPEGRVLFEIQQWLFDERFVHGHIDTVEGLAFASAEAFPGPVRMGAPRVEAAIQLDCDYSSEPGYGINGQQQVRRMTGYYAAPGEIVTIIVPQELVNQGIQVLVGAHQDDFARIHTRFNRFPRVGNRFSVNSQRVRVANPFGGGIYFTIPDPTELGTHQIRLYNVVKAPYFSTRTGAESSLADWRRERDTPNVAWFDWETDNFMTTLPISMARDIDDPSDLLAMYNEVFGEFAWLAGRPRNKFRAEYMSVDRQNPTPQSRLSAQYPMFAGDNNAPLLNGDRWWSPITNYRNDRIDWVVLHEFGHLHNAPGLAHEIESNVNLWSAYVHQAVLGFEADEAMSASIFQELTIEEAALDWIFTDNFINGQRIGHGRYGHMLQYQSRGHAKFADIGRLFGWEVIRNANLAFIQRRIETGQRITTVGDDDYIRTMSRANNINLAPLFEFWGILPSDALVQELADLAPPTRFLRQLEHYRALVPKTPEAFLYFYERMTYKVTPPNGSPRYIDLQQDYTQAFADATVARIDAIAQKYYGVDASGYLNHIVRFRSLNFRDHYFRHRNYQFWIDRVSNAPLYVADSSFRVLPSPLGYGVVLQSVNFTGLYLGVRGDKLVWLKHHSNTPSGWQTVTWLPKTGLGHPDGISFESFVTPGHYVRHQNYRLKLAPANRTNLFRLDATWLPEIRQ